MPFFGGGGASVANLVGATSSSAGVAGLVPAPAAGDDGRVLNGDATFQSPRYPTKANTVLSGRAIGYIGAGFYTSAGNMTFYNDRQYFMPIFVPSTLSSWNLSLITGGIAGACNAKIALYDYGTDTGLPKTRVAVSSSFSIQNASATEFSTAFSTSIKRGLYFITFSISASSATLQSFTSVGNYMWVGIFSNPTTVNNRSLKYSTVTWDTSDCPATIDTSKISMTDENLPRTWMTYT